MRSFRLQDLLSQAPAMQKVTINIEESTLSHQVQRAFGTKLRELVITGSNLERILPDAFAGLFTHELTIRISGTKVQKFPDGLLRYLPDVRYLTLDLRNNLLTTMGPRVLAAVTREGTDVHQTQHIAGSILKLRFHTNMKKMFPFSYYIYLKLRIFRRKRDSVR